MIYLATIPVVVLAAESNVSERLVAHYYAKLREEDLAAVANCMDAADLAAFRQKLVAVLDAGFLGAMPAEALHVFTQGDDLAAVKKYPPEKLFQRFMELISLMEPQLKDLLANSYTEIIGSVPEGTKDERMVHVLARTVIPNKTGSQYPIVVLTARMHDHKWRLMIPQDISLAIEMLHAQAMAQGSSSATNIQTLIDAGPEKAHAEILNMLSAGRQKDAEDTLTALTGAFPDSQPLAFAQAVCSRSRWAKSRADWQFSRVMEMDPSSVEGKSARYMLDLDARKMVEDNMNGLRILIQQNPENPLLLWLMGMACQDNFKQTGKTTYAREGERSYRALLQLWNVGPVLLHQTFANILAEQLDLKEEALVHRRIAVELEPKAWTYQGLANTLTSLERYDEADAAFTKMIELEANNAQYWQNWAHMLNKAKRHEECIEKCQKAVEIDPAYVEAYKTWAWALEQLARFEDALTMYKKAISIAPNDFVLYKNSAGILKKLGREDEATKLLEERNNLPGW